MLSVSRASIRQAISALEAKGIVEIRHGDGTCILDELNSQSHKATVDGSGDLGPMKVHLEAIESEMLADLEADTAKTVGVKPR